jgi:hypothetical protein
MPEINVSELLQAAVQNAWCVRIGCGTCGAREFNQAIDTYLSSHATSGEEVDLSRLHPDVRALPIGSQKLIRHLARLEPPSSDPQFNVAGGPTWQEALQGLLVFSWYRLKEPELREHMRRSLSGTAAGGTLERMIRQNEEKQAQRAARIAYHSPNARKQRITARQNAHKVRCTKKSIRDARLIALAISLYGEGLSRSEMFGRLYENGAFART